MNLIASQALGRQGEGKKQMGRKLETAHISFGLVTIPVGIYPAVDEQDIHFNLLCPKLALAHFNLGVVLEDRQKRREAQAAYQEALRLAPDFREAHCNLAQLYETLGRRRDALRHYAAAKRLSIFPALQLSPLCL